MAILWCGRCKSFEEVLTVSSCTVCTGRRYAVNSYDGWRSEGYQVKRGEKSVLYHDGQPVFHSGQVEKTSRQNRARQDEYDYVWYDEFWK